MDIKPCYRFDGVYSLCSFSHFIYKTQTDQYLDIPVFRYMMGQTLYVSHRSYSGLSCPTPYRHKELLPYEVCPLQGGRGSMLLFQKKFKQALIATLKRITGFREQ